MVIGCPNGSESRLRVCEAHWAMLPPELRERWWVAWHRNARVKQWGAARKACLEYLAANRD